MRRRLGRPSEGFSLLMLAAWLLALGIAVAGVLALLPNQVVENRTDQTIQDMRDAQDDLLGFVVEHSRLPEPDTDPAGGAGHGLESAGADAGALPFRTMQLPEAALDPPGFPLRYAPYRNAAAEADLAVATQLYAPGPAAPYPQKLPTPGDYDCPAIPASPINLLDFCVALENARTATASASYANTGPGTLNAAFVLVSGGFEDADGNGLDSTLDGPNDDGDVSYEDPGRGRGPGYDDIVRPVPAARLERELSCNALVGSVDLLVAMAADQEALVNNISDQESQGEVSVALDAFSVLMNAIVLANAVASAGGAAIEAGINCVVCVASLGLAVNACVACAAITVQAAIAAAGAAVAAIDLAASLATLGTSIALLVEINDLLNEAKDHLCDVIADVVAADLRGGLL